MAFKQVFLTALLHKCQMAAILLTQYSSFVLYIYLFIYLSIYLPVQLISYNTDRSVV